MRRYLPTRLRPAREGLMLCGLAGGANRIRTARPAPAKGSAAGRPSRTPARKPKPVKVRSETQMAPPGALSQPFRSRWDHEFESVFLQRRVACEPDFLFLARQRLNRSNHSRRAPRGRAYRERSVLLFGQINIRTPQMDDTVLDGDTGRETSANFCALSSASNVSRIVRSSPSAAEVFIVANALARFARLFWRTRTT